MAKKTEISTAPHTEPDFKGYTMDELRYQRALIALKREYCKESIVDAAVKLHKSLPLSASGQKGLARNIGGVAGKIVGGLNYIDYLLIGFSAFGTIRKVFHFFKKKK